MALVEIIEREIEGIKLVGMKAAIKRAMETTVLRMMEWKNTYFPYRTGALCNTAELIPNYDALAIIAATTQTYAVFVNNMRGVHWTRTVHPDVVEQFFDKWIAFGREVFHNAILQEFTSIMSAHIHITSSR